MKEGESVNDYFARTLTIVNKMRIQGEPMSDVIVIEKVMRSMSSKFAYVVCSIEESNDLDSMSIDELQSSLLVHEERMSGHVIEEQALMVAHKDNSGGSGIDRGASRGRGRGRATHADTIDISLDWGDQQDTNSLDHNHNDQPTTPVAGDQVPDAFPGVNDAVAQQNSGEDSLEEAKDPAQSQTSDLSERRIRHPPIWMRDYESGERLSNTKNQGNCAIFDQKKSNENKETVGFDLGWGPCMKQREKEEVVQCGLAGQRTKSKEKENKVGLHRVVQSSSSFAGLSKRGA
ncbi:hypothetical protein F0562_032211 [Nyssa sinensis]|uniref:Retrovirus-related Pol polyprotein from transposon TNT 1-94 n=1 Tax=Nyssa sinensis TaxID=561372 RepID=A0A5J5AWG1_9ASTE|nr:hypothetical protein F0562_032211 [Nyssa sinensis]